jgi:ankyrin repeat protein
MRHGRLTLVLVLAAALAAVASWPERPEAAQAGGPRDALFSAIKSGSAAEVEGVLASGADPDAVGEDGMTALIAATLFGEARMVAALAGRGADPNRSGVGGTTALMWAVPDVEKVRILLDAGANVDARSETERTALLVAASYPGTTDLLRLLLDRGADLRAADRAGATALSLAARSSDVEVVRFLVERGLDPAGLSAGARRAAFARYDLPTTDYLMRIAPAPAQDLLGTAATWQPPAHVSRWIDAGAEVNASSAAQYGRTPLMNAVTSEAEGVETLRLLLEKGANPNAEMSEGERPLDWAIYKGDRAKIDVLQQYGATRGRGPRREEIPPPAPGGIADARVAVTRSTARLMEVAPKFRDQATCISCHHNAMPALAAAAAKGKGIAVEETGWTKNLADLVGFFATSVPRMALGDPAVGGEALTTGYTLLALAASGHAPDAVTTTMAHWLMARQMPDGRWLGNGLNRPPSEYSVVSHTAIAAGGLQAYPLPGRAAQRAATLRRARQWLLAAEPASAEERAMRLMGLVWTDAPRERVMEAVGAIREQQEATGGWSQFGRTPPDAYATGQSLYALRLAGVPTTDETYRRGVAFLLGAQYQDGTWLVRTHAFPVQRYFESGFPYGRHQWISTAGTSWATLAIAETLP